MPKKVASTTPILQGVHHPDDDGAQIVVRRAEGDQMLADFEAGFAEQKAEA
jgi:hypothetical protein